MELNFIRDKKTYQTFSFFKGWNKENPLSTDNELDYF